MAQLDPRLQALPEKVVEALKAGNPVLAIKLLREAKGVGLKEARDLLIALRDRIPVANEQAAAKQATLQLDPLPGDVQQALARGNKIEAIRLLRAKTGLGLKEAKDAVDRIAASMPPRPVTSTPGRATRPTGLAPGEVPRSGGVLWRVIVVVALTLLAYWFLREG